MWSVGTEGACHCKQTKKNPSFDLKLQFSHPLPSVNASLLGVVSLKQNRLHCVGLGLFDGGKDR